MPRYKTLRSNLSINNDLITSSEDLARIALLTSTADSQIKKLVEKAQKGKLQRTELEKAFGTFIGSTEKLLEQLERERLRVIQAEYRKLAELKQLLEQELQGVPHDNVTRKISQIQEQIINEETQDLSAEFKGEKRVMKGKGPFGFFIAKLRPTKQRAVRNERLAAKLSILENSENILLHDFKEKINKYRAGKYWTRRGLEQDLLKILEDYEKDFRYLHIIEIDCEIEEAARLHKIEHYIQLAKVVGMAQHVQILEQLKQKASYWVYQDLRTKRKIHKFAKGLKPLAKRVEWDQLSKQKEFPNVEEKEHNFDEIRGSFYINKNQPPKAGCVVVHGIFGDRHGLQVLSKQLAASGYIVYAFDLPARLANKDVPFRLGIISEHISKSVKLLRDTPGVRSVAVIGHSAGAVGSMFAAMGYNTIIEDEVFRLNKEILSYADKVANTNFMLEDPSTNQYIKKMHEKYTQLKIIILETFKAQVFSHSRIDALVAVSAPRKFQINMRPTLAKLLKLVPFKWIKAFKSYGNKSLEKAIEKKHGSKRYTEPKVGKSEIAWETMVITDLNDFLNYVISMKNPCDFMELVNFFSSLEYQKVREKEADIIRDRVSRYMESKDKAKSLDLVTSIINKEVPIITFMRAYRKRVIGRIPKLFMRGTLDIVTRGFIDVFLNKLSFGLIGREGARLEQTYMSLGNAVVLRYRSKHLLNLVDDEGNETGDVEAIKSSRVVSQILYFLDHNLAATPFFMRPS